MPVVIYKMKKNKIFWLSGNKIDELLRKAVQMICSDTTPDHLNRYSAHLLHDKFILVQVGKKNYYLELLALFIIRVVSLGHMSWI
jgi:hypothetical protein